MLSGSIRPSGAAGVAGGQAESRSPQSAELLFQHFGSQRAFFCRLKGLGRLHGTSVFRTGNRQGFPTDPAHVRRRGMVDSCKCSRIFFNSAFRAGSSVFQSFCPGLTLLQSIRDAFPWKKRRFLCTFQIRPPCSSLRSSPASMDEAVPGRERNAPFRPDIQPALTAVHNDACVGAPLFTVAAVGQTRVVRPVQPAGGEAA